MRDYIIILPLATVFLLIKSSMLYWLPLPDILLIIVFHLAITRPTAAGVVLTFIIGYLADAFTASVMGTSSFSLIVVYLAIYLFSHKIDLKSRNSQTLVLGIFATVKGLIVFYFMYDLVELSSLYKIVIPTALITGLFAPAVLPILKRLDNKFELNKFKGSFH